MAKIKILDLSGDYGDSQSRQKHIAICSRCFLAKEVGETVIYKFSVHQEIYDICVDCLPFVRAISGNEEVERHRKRAEANPYSSKERPKILEPYLHFNRSRWRTRDEIKRGVKIPDYNEEGECVVPGVTLWCIVKDGKDTWEERPLL
jgi:hypothetical protein